MLSGRSQSSTQAVKKNQLGQTRGSRINGEPDLDPVNVLVLGPKPNTGLTCRTRVYPLWNQLDLHLTLGLTQIQVYYIHYI